jgi:hypothetical protein
MQKYALTNLNKDGQRVLTFANQGRNHYDTRQEAQALLDLFKEDLRARVLDNRADTLEVHAIECYENGDAKSIFISGKE